MSDAAFARPSATQPNAGQPNAGQGRPQASATDRVSELRVSGNLMRLETGLYCIVNKPVDHADLRSGLPGVRLSPAPGIDSRPEQVEISTFRGDGWLSGFGDAALVRVHSGPVHVLLTIYQSPDHPEAAPNIQVVKLLDTTLPQAGTTARQSGTPLGAALTDAMGSSHVTALAAELRAPGEAGGPRVMDMVAHIQGLGDVGALLGDRLGEVGSKRWIEGFAIAPARNIAPGDIEYQAVLGRGWLSPWVEGGEFCGSRGMALPVLGLRVRLRGDAARDFDCSYAASFTDGTQSGQVAAGGSCESESLAPLESFQVMLRPRVQAPVAPRPTAPAPTPAPPPAASPTPKAAPPMVPAAKAAAPKDPAPKALAPKAAAAKPAAKSATKPAAKPVSKAPPRRR